jgi:hypothetical protein
MSSSRTMQSVPTRKPRRGRLWQLHLKVLPRSTGRCTTTTPPTHHASRIIINTSVNSSSGLPTHLSTNTSRQHPRLYLHLRLCCACLRHRPLKPPPATPASTAVARATSLKSAPRQRRTSPRATSLTRHMVRRRWPLRRPTVSTTPLWRTLPRASKSSRLRFL